MKKTMLRVCATLALAAGPCVAAAQSWDGTWKLNEAKSKFNGETYVIEAKGNGLMHYSNGSMNFDFACDGKDYPVLADRTFACTGSPASGYDYVSKAGEKELTKSHRTFSADGKTMVIETKGDWIKVYSPAYKETVEGNMDGNKLAVKGPETPPGFSQSFKPDGPNKLHYTVSYNDKVLSEGVQTLNADGKTLVDENWSPGKMNEKSTSVYERQ